MSPSFTDEEFTRLIRFPKRSKDKFAIGFARGLSRKNRDVVVGSAASALAEDGMSLQSIDFAGQTMRSLYNHLVPELPEGTGAAVVVTGLETAIFGPEGDLFLRVLNLEYCLVEKSVRSGRGVVREGKGAGGSD